MKNSILKIIVLPLVIALLPVAIVAQTTLHAGTTVYKSNIPVHIQKALNDQEVSNLIHYLKFNSVEVRVKNGNILLLVMDMDADSEERINSFLERKNHEFNKKGFHLIKPNYRDFQNNLTYASYAGYIGDQLFYISKSVDHKSSKMMIAISTDFYSFRKEGYSKSKFAAITR